MTMFSYQPAVLVLLLQTWHAQSSITLSCFSIPVLDLPTVGVSGYTPFIQSGVRLLTLFIKNISNILQVNFLNNVGASTSGAYDVCAWGLIR